MTNTTASQNTAFPPGRNTEGLDLLLTDGHVIHFQGVAVSFGYMAFSPTNGQGVGSANNAAGTAAQDGSPSFTARFSPNQGGSA